MEDASQAPAVESSTASPASVEVTATGSPFSDSASAIPTTLGEAGGSSTESTESSGSTDSVVSANPGPTVLQPAVAVGENNDFRANLNVGSIVDARDTVGTWYTSSVMQVQGSTVLIHYHGWDNKWDEWMNVESDRLAVQGSMAPNYRPPNSTANIVPAFGAVWVQGDTAETSPPVPLANAIVNRYQQWGRDYLTSRTNISSHISNYTHSSSSSSSASPPAAVVSPEIVSPTEANKPKSVPAGGFAIKKAGAAAAAASSASFAATHGASSGPAFSSASPSPSASAPVSAEEFIHKHKQQLMSRTSYAKLRHLIERREINNSFVINPRNDRAAAVHKIITGITGDPLRNPNGDDVTYEKLVASLTQQSTAVVPSPLPRTQGENPMVEDQANAIANASSAAASSGIIIPSIINPHTMDRSSLPSLSYFDSSGMTLLMRIIQVYLDQEDREYRACFRQYIPFLTRALQDEEYDPNHADSKGQTTLHWIVRSKFTPRPGGFLFELLKIVLSLGANPNYLTNRGESVLQLVVENAGQSFDLIGPVLQLLRSHGADVNEVDGQGNTILHRLVQSSKLSSGLLEECIQNSLEGYDLFAVNNNRQTIIDLIAHQITLQPENPQLQLAVSLLMEFMQEWQQSISPFLKQMVDAHMAPELSAMVMEYLDGSGKPFEAEKTATGDGSSSSTQEKPSKPWNEFAQGDLIDCLDTANKWYASTVMDIREDAVRMHFNGWPSNWDEWIEKTSTRLAPLGTHAANYGNFPIGGAIQGIPLHRGEFEF